MRTEGGASGSGEVQGWLSGGSRDGVLLGQLCEGLEAGLGGHQATDGLEVALQLGVGPRQLRVLGEQRQDRVVDQLLLVLREQTLGEEEEICEDTGTNRKTNFIQTDRQRQMHRQRQKQRDRQRDTDRCTGRGKDKETDREMDAQTEVETETEQIDACIGRDRQPCVDVVHTHVLCDSVENSTVGDIGVEAKHSICKVPI